LIGKLSLANSTIWYFVHMTLSNLLWVQPDNGHWCLHSTGNLIPFRRRGLSYTNCIVAFLDSCCDSHITGIQFLCLYCRCISCCYCQFQLHLSIAYSMIFNGNCYVNMKLKKCLRSVWAPVYSRLCSFLKLHPLEVLATIIESMVMEYTGLKWNWNWQHV